MINRRLIWHLLTALMFVSVSCAEPWPPLPDGDPLQSRGVKCDFFAEYEELHAIPYGELDAEQTIAWFSTAHDLPKRAFAPNGPTDLQWLKGRERYYANFKEGLLSNIRVKWAKPSPRGDDVLHCFGQPDLYEATIWLEADARGFGLELWYLSEGLVFSTSPVFSQTHKLPPPISGNIGMGDMIVVRPGTAEEIMRQRITYGEYSPKWLEYLMPWPGGWEEIEVLEAHF
jgi:hypothetical protein